MKTDTEIRANIMKRIYMIYFMRQITHPAIRVVAFVSVIFLLFQSVSVKNVVANALETSGVPGFTKFILSALTSTEPFVLVLLILSILFIVWFVYEIVHKEIMLREMGL